MQIIGYKRVSSFEQNTDRQLDGIKLDKVFEDKASGGSADRPELTRMLDHAREGDVIMVHSIDRLARNLSDLLELLKDFKTNGITIKFVKEGLEFTSDDNPFQQLQMQIIGAVSEFERSMIKARQREGIEKAKADGRYRGGKKSLDREKVLNLIAEGVGPAKIAKQLNVARSSVYRIIKEDQATTTPMPG